MLIAALLEARMCASGLRVDVLGLAVSGLPESLRNKQYKILLPDSVPHLARGYLESDC